MDKPNRKTPKPAAITISVTDETKQKLDRLAMLNGQRTSVYCGQQLFLTAQGLSERVDALTRDAALAESSEIAALLPAVEKLYRACLAGKIYPGSSDLFRPDAPEAQPQNVSIFDELAEAFDKAESVALEGEFIPRK